MNCLCGTTLGPTNKSGKCKPCHARFLNTDPEMRRRRSEGLLAHYDQPGVRDRRRQSLLRAMANLSDAERKRRSDRAKVHAATVLHSPEVVARTFTAEALAKRGASHTETRLGWCPPSLRDQYRYLIYTKHILAADARRMIEEMVPGTAQHAKRVIANSRDAMRIKAERDRDRAY